MGLGSFLLFVQQALLAPPPVFVQGTSVAVSIVRTRSVAMNVVTAKSEAVNLARSDSKAGA
jgi:hypothetical protein